MDFLFLLFYDLFDRVITYEVHVDFDTILIDNHFVYVLINYHTSICQGSVLEQLLRSLNKCFFRTF